MSAKPYNERLCPFAQTFGASQQLADGPGPNCVGDDCMAWQPLFVDQGAYGTHVRSGGYCGLIGQENRKNNHGR